MKDLRRQIAAKEEYRVIVHTASANGKSQLGTVDLAATKEYHNNNYFYITLLYCNYNFYNFISRCKTS